MENIIEVSDLTKRYGEVTAVDKLSLEIGKGGIFGLLGPNGAGKTTTISMLCGLLPPTEGSVHFIGFDGRDPKTLIGYCPQENIFYPRLTCLEQLIFIGQMHGIKTVVARERATILLNLLGISEKAHARAANLSGGMKRRLNICLALIHHPEILILDEPETGLDPQSRILVRDFIRQFGKEKTVILTTHNMDEADRLADHIAIIDYGRLLMLDTPGNLKRTIGEGDMLEIIPGNGDDGPIDRFAEAASTIATLMSKGKGGITFKHTDMISVLPAIRAIAEKTGFNMAEVKLRETTLEDVFIQLTGRNLRQ